MKRSSIRAFGIALFLVGAFYTAIDQFNIPLSSLGISDASIRDANANKEVKKLTVELKNANKTIASLQSKLKETNTKNTAANTEQSKETTNETQSNSNTEPQAEATYTLEIYRNMTPYAIGEKLEDAGIIENAIEIEMFLARDEYRGRLQIGAFNLNASMTLKEIADTITKTKNDQ